MNTLENAIPILILKGFPVLMTRYLCGTVCAHEVGVSEKVSWVSCAFFALGMTVTRAIDAVIRWVLPEFSIARPITRVMCYHLMSRVLLDQTRPLKLPQHLLNQVTRAMSNCSDDAKASGWLNSIEDKLTQRGQKL